MAAAPEQQQKLPDDLIFMGVLLRLPETTLFRFKSVCKSWHRTICDTKYAVAHHNNKPAAAAAEFLIRFDLKSFKLLTFSAASGIAGVNILSHDGPNKLLELYGDAAASNFRSVIVDSLYGVVLVGCFPVERRTSFYYLFNPIEASSGVRVPDPLRRRSPAEGAGMGFAYDPAANRLKLVTPFRRVNRCHGFLVFDLASAAGWAETAAGEDVELRDEVMEGHSNVVFAGEMLYWRLEYDGDEVLCFDPWEETGGTVTLPSRSSAFRATDPFVGESLGRWEDRLTLVRACEAETEFWTLGGGGAWTMLYKLDMNDALLRHRGFFSGAKDSMLGCQLNFSPAFPGLFISLSGLMFRCFEVMPLPICTDEEVYLKLSRWQIHPKLGAAEDVLYLHYNLLHDRWSVFFKGYVDNGFHRHHPSLFSP